MAAAASVALPMAVQIVIPGIVVIIIIVLLVLWLLF
jgi:hypothetical protein